MKNYFNCWLGFSFCIILLFTVGHCSSVCEPAIDHHRFNHPADEKTNNISDVVLCEENHKIGPKRSTIFPFETYGNHKYYFATDYKATWYGAADFCRIYDLAFLKINTESENTYIVERLKKFSKREEYWIGGTDSGSEKDYYWDVDGTSVIKTSWNWSPGQPDNAGNKENCMTIWGTHNYKWNDRPCKNYYHFICETVEL